MSGGAGSARGGDDGRGGRNGGRDGGRPLVERIGMAIVAAVIAVMFGGIALAAFVGGEGFLAVMSAVGALMTLWVAGLTLFRG